MRDHEACEEAINAALAKGRDGYAYFLAERCDTHHGELEPPPRDIRAQVLALIHPRAHLSPKHPLSLPHRPERVRAATHRFRPGQPLAWGTP